MIWGLVLWSVFWQGFKVRLMSVVKIRWGTKNGTFSIKSLYANLEEGSAVQFPAGIVWKLWVPLKFVK